MAEHSLVEVVTGGVVIAAAVGFVAFGAQFAGLRGPAGDDYTLSASFRSAEGIGVGTDVRLAGVKVGTVLSMDLDPATFRAETVFTVDGALELPDDTALLVSSEGLLGGSFLELVPGGSPFNIEPGAQVLDTQSSVSLITLLLRFVSGDGDAE